MVTIYPNPVVSELVFSICINSSEDLEFFVINTFGVVKQKGKIRINHCNYRQNIDISNLESGFYSLHVVHGRLSETKKFIKI
ncbi:MAG: T9SS type A sorting domain-containing protein [Saprospiraceae bacterium]|nr:T9SS type A sorting domain-containing protein [Saprospiraceae bacterium]